MTEDTILDSNTHSKAKELTDFQLVGVLTEKVKYPPNLLEEIENEQNQRNLSALEIDDLRKEYLAPVLVKEGFTVLAYTNDDIIYAKKLEEAGATSVMPLGSPIGSGQGILNPNNVKIIIE